MRTGITNLQTLEVTLFLNPSFKKYSLIIYYKNCSIFDVPKESRFFRYIFYNELGAVRWVKNCPRKYMVSLGSFTSYHDQNYSDYRSASVIPIYNPEYIIRICNLIDFGHDWVRMHQGLPYSYQRKFCTQLKAPNLP